MNNTHRYRVENARRDQLTAIQAVERAAETAFSVEDLPLALRGAMRSSEAELEAALRDGLLWCAVDEHGDVLGFAIARWLGRDLHLDEIDVLPACQKRGIGGALVTTVRQHAVAHGVKRLTLTTFRAPPWNERWYAKLGFVAFEEHSIPQALRAIHEEEIAAGLARERRVAMAFELNR